MAKNYSIAQLDDIAAVICPCGAARRAFVEAGNSPASLHVVDISADDRPHYHKRTTEIYFVLEGEGHVELDGEAVPVKPMTAVLIRPGCRHRAVGPLRIVNVVIPPFDPADEWFDE
ncbi:MAG: cupin domain-containing protein [Phycisphaerae bacterium]|nr:cupin domain-containing protein [Phycisphaerae bacterium]